MPYEPNKSPTLPHWTCPICDKRLIAPAYIEICDHVDSHISVAPPVDKVRCLLCGQKGLDGFEWTSTGWHYVHDHKPEDFALIYLRDLQ